MRAWGPRRLLLAAMLVDTLGSGLLGPFELLYGHAVAGLTLGAAGLALSIGTALAIAVGPLAGAVVDRVGAGRVSMGANLTSAVGCVLLLLAHGALVFGSAAFVLAAGTRTFWASFSTLVLAVTTGDEPRAWFGRIRSLRYAGITGGQALAGAILLLGQRDGLRALVGGDAISYLVALVLLGAAFRGTSAPLTQTDHPRPPRYRVALADRANVTLAALNVISTLVISAPLLAMPVLVIEQLHFPAWLPGLLAALNTAAIAIPAFFAGRLLRRRSTLAVLALAALLWAMACTTYAIASTARSVAFVLLPLGIVILGVGEAAYAPTADSLPLELAPTGLAGRYTALHQLAWGISGAIAPTLAALLLTHGKATLWLALAAAAFGLAAAYTTMNAMISHRLRPL